MLKRNDELCIWNELMNLTKSLRLFCFRPEFEPLQFSQRCSFSHSPDIGLEPFDVLVKLDLGTFRPPLARPVLEVNTAL